MACKYCKKDLEYRLCSLCGDIFPKELFYVTGKKEHTCDDGLKKIIEYRRTQCQDCYLQDQKRLYLNDKFVHNPQYEDQKKRTREEENMELPVYITVEEVERVCKKLNISDWSAKDRPQVSLDEARVIFEKLQERFKIATIYVDYGIIYKNQKTWGKSLKNFEKGIKILEELKLPYYIGKAYHEMAMLYKAQGKKAKTKAFIKKANTQYKKIGFFTKVKKVKKVKP